MALFQPHRYTRTQALREEFGQAFHQADVVMVTDIYPASETPITGVSGQTVVDALHRHGHQNAAFEPLLHRLAARVGTMVQPGDLLISMGAGNIHEAATQLVRDLKLLEEFQTEFGDDIAVRLYEPLAKHTTLRVGGPARFWAEPTTAAALAGLVKFAHRHYLPIFLIGRGSNLLVRDGGIDGLVIHPTGGEFAELKVNAETSEITAGAAVGLKRLCGTAAKAGIGGFEWMEGIPGAVGGSLRMNAGAMGVETFDQVVRIHIVDEAGEIQEVSPEQMEVHYRNVPTLKTKYAVAATFRGQASNVDDIQRLLVQSSAKRKTSQPIAASAGCIFKNPSRECPAGKLVQELELKNAHEGAARVSEVHGNFIVNDGGASAKEVLALIERIKQAAFSAHGIRMETEVQIVGQD